MGSHTTSLGKICHLNLIYFKVSVSAWKWFNHGWIIFKVLPTLKNSDDVDLQIHGGGAETCEDAGCIEFYVWKMSNIL